MTPERMRQIRETMHLPLRSLARWTDRNPAGLRQMEAGQRHIPDEFGDWLETIGRFIEKNQPPKKSR
jgi:hypothetical protein